MLCLQRGCHCARIVVLSRPSPVHANSLSRPVALHRAPSPVDPHHVAHRSTCWGRTSRLRTLRWAWPRRQMAGASGC